ncbi:hypothetical protein LTR27_008408 [Elasticomyces elasticus]|nr:hypothetical protein LTR27_008408 [Elasticomyces elasticus]
MPSLIIRDVRIFDGETCADNSSLWIQDGVIKAVGGSFEDADAEVLSMPGHTLLPGLIDAHCHPYGDVKLPKQSFRFGITTIVDMHNTHENAVQQKKWSQQRKDFPDVKSAHYAATIHGGWPAYVEMKLSNNEHATFDQYPNVNTEEAASSFVEQAATNGTDFIKLMHEGGRAIGIPEGVLAQPTLAVQAAVVREAHERGMKVVAHALAQRDTIDVLRAGVDGLAHTFFDEPISPEVIDLYRHNDAWVIPTTLCAGTLTGESLEIVERFCKDDRVRSKISPEQAQLAHGCLHMKSAGASGSDAAAGAPGLPFGASLLIEMYLLVTKAGMTPIEVLRSATSITADCFGWPDRGRLAVGLKADMLLVAGNPLNDITKLLDVRGIWRDGVKFDSHEGFSRARITA